MLLMLEGDPIAEAVGFGKSDLFAALGLSEFLGTSPMHFDEEGRIVAHDNFFDQLSMMVQLGFAEPPPHP